MSTGRTVVAARDGVALAEPTQADLDLVNAGSDGPYDPDEDPRPGLYLPPVHRLLVVDAETGEPLGKVNWLPVTYGRTLSCHAWNIGIGLVAAARGRGVGTLAQRLLVEHLFATTELDRVEADTDVDNLAEQRALEKAGLRREGVLRGAQLRGGVRRDMVKYGVLREDFQ
ncbi:hypothetical protein GCM10010174_08940 [Kutzneria viridogrisea]|uniref:N-acetyltransferase domain-containing protein n=2 Tax=Kutzneria TaxID=43356 RepID=W5WJW7_9PSEU|nr:GNAT family protein [Kutzneria albida]AHI01504.1 hypothetical protein KALB_8146 [Kutzneria albida DSM 43870]MBA8931467.1 RimJ/RimL family protein N-acetyltransferase [Kutzneria viridogrisea]